MTSVSELTLSLTPQARLDLIDIPSLIEERYGDVLSGYSKAAYYSYHTTAGYLDQNLCAQLDYNCDSLQDFVGYYQGLFPPNADYHHDQLDLRSELTAEQKLEEPRNADAHLTFISSGLANLATYPNAPDVPVYFIDLDGINGKKKRLRRTTVIGYNREELVDRASISVPVSKHAIDSVNLRDKALDLSNQLRTAVKRLGIHRGRIDISLDAQERHAGLTVNEYETMLMKHDMVEVLRNPLRFMAERGKHALLDLRSIPSKVKGYARYDLVQFINEFIDSAGLSDSILENLIHRFMAFPASRRLRMKRSVSLLVLDQDGSGKGDIVEGTYQSPILIQWKPSKSQSRVLKVDFIQFR